MWGVEMMVVAAAVASLGAAVELEVGKWETVSNVNESALSYAAAAGCGVDDEFVFAVYKGEASAKIMIEFEGGGLCLSKESCIDNIAKPGECYQNQIPQDYWSTYTGYMALSTLNHDNEAHPFKEWSHIYITYCTCDFHWGNRVVDFAANGTLPGGGAEVPEGEEGTPDNTFHFRGYNNFKFVMEWLQANKEQFGFEQDPEELLVTGCSAGAYGASLLQEEIFETFPTSKRSTFFDSAFGSLSYLPMDLLTNLTKPETPFTALSSEALQLDVDLAPLPSRSISRLQQAVADKYPRSDFTLFANLDDYRINSRQGLVDSIAENEAAGRCNFRSWVPNSTNHCLLYYTFFTETLPDGSLVVDQLAKLSSGECVGSILPEDVPELANSSGFDICQECSAEEPEPSSAHQVASCLTLLVVMFAFTLR